MACTIKIDFDKAPALKKLHDYCGASCNQFYNFIVTVIDDIGATELKFKDAFKEWWSDPNKGNRKETLDIKTTNSEILKQGIIEYFYTKYPDASDGVRIDSSYDRIRTYDYFSVGSRERGKRHFANKVLLVANLLETNPNLPAFINFVTNNIKRELKNASNEQIVQAVAKALNKEYGYWRNRFCFEVARIQMAKTFAERLAPIVKQSAESLRKKIIIPNNSAEIAELLKGHEDEISIDLQNLMAFCTELYATKLNIDDNDTNPAKELLEEVSTDSRLHAIRLRGPLSEDKQREDDAQSENNEDNPEVSSDDVTNDIEYDSMIRLLDSKLGTYTTYMTHVGQDIRTVLGSLKKLQAPETSKGEFVEDTDNDYGIADLMDANQCCQVLYNYGKYGNVDEMMASIKEIARTLPGFGAFDTLYKLLENNEDLKIKFHSIFSKLTVSKKQMIHRNGVDTMVISNEGLNRTLTVRVRFRNDINSSSITADHDAEKFKVTDKHIGISARIDKDFDNDRRNIITDLYNAFKTYYPTITEECIRSYIILGPKTEKENAQTLVKLLIDTINGAKDSENLFNKRQAAISLAQRNNRIKLNRSRQENSDGISTLTSDDLENINDLYATSYISEKSNAACTKLANILSDYMLVDTPLNSTNVAGNKSSDVINMSLLLRLKSILESSLNSAKTVTDAKGITRVVWDENSPIVKFGQYRSKSKQYDFSNILIETKDEDGKIINYGLFYKDEKGAWIPTDYAQDLLKINLFDGAQNADAGTNALYSKMSKGDYIGTAWRAFYNTTATGHSDKVADYFMRIPSDAPKNFIITAPRYSSRGLLTMENKTKIQEQINTIVKSVLEQKVPSAKGVVFIDTPIIVNKSNGLLKLDDFVNHITTTPDNGVDIRIFQNRQKSLTRFEGKQVRIAFRYAESSDDGRKDNVYVMEGTYSNGTLKQAIFTGFVGKDEKHIEDDITNRTDVKKSISDALWSRADVSGQITWGVNQNHVIFKQFQKIFRQELTDMAVAARLLFETEKLDNGNYIIKVRGNKPVLKKSKLIKSNTEHNGLHPVYHYADNEDDGKRSPIYITKNGKIQATGKVFTSDRFIMYDYFADNGEESIYNYGQDILDEAFSLFSITNPNDELLLQFDEYGNVIISDEQQEIINKHLSKFITEYVNNARLRLLRSENVINNSNNTVTTNNAAEFILNTHLAYVAFNDLFEGDTKFYKNAQTFLKRAKECQGSGVPYGLTDLSKPIDENPSTLVTKTVTTKRLVNGEVVTETKEIKVGSTFRAATIYNTITTDTIALNAIHSFITDPDEMGDAVLTEKEADVLLYGPNGKGGYQNATVNDAQSYITFDEWVRRIILRGQYPQYKELIERILDETQPLRVNDLKHFIQVQKNFYYDQHYNPETGVIGGRQIKNAEFVLVPRLVKGTELEKVLQLMERIGVQQLNTAETSKAAQGRKYYVWDRTGNFRQDILDDLDNLQQKPKSDIIQDLYDAGETFEYANLYTQLENPQHIDSENKVGLQVIKKLVDNIGEHSPKELRDAKEQFFKLMTANIKDSFNGLMKRFKIGQDENGNIKLDENGNISEINYDEFFNALKDELIRLGLDSNLIDYCTRDARSIFRAQTVMPNYFSLIASKFENVVQSLFNNSITRQTLPGFHAAQISGMGFRKLSEMVDRARTSNDLQYHPQLYKNENGVTITQREYDQLDAEQQKEFKKDRLAHYIEIRLPAANFGFDRNHPKYANMTKEQQDEAFLAELRLKGADEIIGYRIPSEGKQSICCMKVVGFTNDALGSTIVVPDDWVPQTGADFDIDSIYGIQYSTYIDSDGTFRVAQYIDDYNKLYNRYILSHLNKEEYEQLREDIKITDAMYQDLKKKHTNEQNEVDKEALFDEIAKMKQQAIHAAYVDIVEKKGLKTFDEFKKQSIEDLNSRAARNNKILDNLKTMLTHPASFEENLSRSNFDDVIDALNKTIGDKSKESYRRKARSPYNFLDQADFHEDAISGLSLKAISVMRDTFLSVCNTVRPTLENNSKIKILYKFENFIPNYKKLNKKEKEAAQEKLLNKLKARFGETNIQSLPSMGGVAVTHTMFGWSNDNKNISNKILTSYSSQTTAHILDAIKSGNVPNVNELTFKVYKTIVDVGSDFDTAVSFIMQPAIARIVRNYNNTNSIYAEDLNRQYINKAIKEIIDELEIEYDKNATIESLLDIVNETYGALINEIFDIKETDQPVKLSINDKDNVNILLNAELQRERFQETGRFGKNYKYKSSSVSKARLIYDLQQLLQYQKINNLAEDIETAARLTNPDKFGAKQTMFATRKVFDDIVESLINNARTDEFAEPGATNFRLQVNNKHLLSVIYPELENVDNGEDALKKILTSDTFVQSSKYPTLAAYLKYATATSIKINKDLFVTQSDIFVDFVNNKFDGLASALPLGTRLTENIVKAFQQYVCNYIIQQSSFLTKPLKYVVKKEGINDSEVGFVHEVTNAINDRNYNGEEVNRVFGYGYSPKLIIEDYYVEPETNKHINISKVFRVKDINNPTQEEIDDFCQLTPAQKVHFIKRHFSNPGVFRHINERLVNEYATNKTKAGAQIIQFIEDSADIETVYQEFKEAFTHTNPLLACAAADVIKYAFFVEGYRMGMGHVSKMIPNSVLTSDSSIFGTGIVDESNMAMGNLDTIIAPSNDNVLNMREELIERFVRSHSNSMGLVARRVAKVNKRDEIARLSKGLIHFNPAIASDKELIEKYNVGVFNEAGPEYNRYVRLTFTSTNKSVTNLYRIETRTIMGESHVFLIPLNELELNENAKWSANTDYHRFYSTWFYQTILDDYEDAVDQTYHFDISDLDKRIKAFDVVAQRYGKNIEVNIYDGFWTREEVQKDKGRVYLFGDNTEDRVSGYVPSSTQAVIRGLPNAIGIDTKKNRGTNDSSYFTNKDFETFKKQVDSAINAAIRTRKPIVIPKDGIGTGKAQLATRAPKCFKYLQDELDKLTNPTRPDYYNSPEGKGLFTPDVAYRINKRMAKPFNNATIEEDHPKTVRAIKQWAESRIEKKKPRVVFWDNTWRNIITNFGKANGVIARVDGAWYHIYKIDLSAVKFNDKHKINIINTYTGKYGIDREIAHSDEENYGDVIRVAREIASRTPDFTIPSKYTAQVIAVEAVQDSETENLVEDDGIFFSTILDVASNSAKNVYRRSRREDDLAGQISRKWIAEGINSRKEELKPHVEEVIRDVANYLESTSNDLITKLNNFVVGNVAYPVDSIECINAVKRDPKLRRDYLKLIQEPGAIVKEWGIIDDLDIDSEDPAVKENLKKIKKVVSDMRSLPIVANAMELFAEEFYGKLTDSPMIKEGFVSILSGFWQTNQFNAMFNDIQETSNPIVQLAMKNLQESVSLAEFQAREDIASLKKFIDDLKKEAASKGQSINWDHIIDDMGRQKQLFNEKFLADRDAKKNAYRNAKEDAERIRKEKGVESDEFKNAKLKELESYLAYEEWKVKYTEQPLVDEYYIKRNKILREALFGSSTSTKHKTRNRLPLYEGLLDERRAIYRSYGFDAQSEEIQERLKQINKKIDNLRNEYVDPDEDDREYIREVNALKTYIKANKQLEEEYHTYDAKFGWADTLKENLQIVADYENSSLSEARRLSNEDYIKAKTWLKKNVIEEPDWGENTDKINEKIRDAFAKLKIYDKHNSNSPKKLTKARQNPRYRNAIGEFDPRLMPAEEIEEIRLEQLDSYNTGRVASFNDRTLIGYRHPETEQYTSEFYRHLRIKSNTTSQTGAPSSDLAKWRKIVTEINDILSRGYSTSTNDFSFPKLVQSLIADFGEERAENELKRLRDLYDSLANIKPNKDDSNETKLAKRKVRNFIKKNTTHVYDTKQYDADMAYIDSIQKSGLKNAMLNVISDFVYDDEDDIVFEDGKAKRKPNRYIYGYLKLKDTVSKADRKKYIDEGRSEAVQTIQQYKTKEPTDYYWQARAQAVAEGRINEWIKANHIYNPYTHAYEPLAIWMQYRNKTDKVNYSPTYSSKTKKIREGRFTLAEAKKRVDTRGFEDYTDAKKISEHYFPEKDYRNKKYKEGLSHGANYKVGSNAAYDNADEKNEYEKRLADKINAILEALATTSSARKWIQEGYMPVRAKDDTEGFKAWALEAIKLLGVESGKYDPNDWDREIDFSTDRVPNMPMLDRLKAKGYREIPKKPERSVRDTDDTYQARLNKWRSEVDRIKANNDKIHKDLLDKNWEEVISDFILKASTYNAIQENKYELYYAKKLIEKYGHYINTWTKGVNTEVTDEEGKTSKLKIPSRRKFVKDSSSSTDEAAEYKRVQDRTLIEQFENQIRRIVYNQFKQTSNPRFVKAMNVWQGITSAQYMMFNYKGGIANVTLGETSILAEAMAGELLGVKDYLWGKQFYASGLLDYVFHAYDADADTLQGAIIKFMDVIDYDENTGIQDVGNTAKKVLQRIRNFGYHPQTSGEHEMQNSAMFSMMRSHRLYLNERHDEFGQPKWIFKNIDEVVRDCYEAALREVLNPNQVKIFDKWLEILKADADLIKDYVWYTKDMVEDFMRSKYVTREQQREFVKKVKETIKQRKEDFNNDEAHPTVISQLTLENKRMGFKKDGLLYEMNKTKSDGTNNDALKFMAMFKRRVIATNKYIHGVYDKSGRAQLEKYALGGLIMQYHKHLPVGIMKRYRIHGMFNEERGMVNKGAYVSLVKFLGMNFRGQTDLVGLTDEHIKSLGLDEDQIKALESVQNIFKKAIDGLLYFKLNYNLMPEYDKANVRRAMTDLYGVLAALALTVGIKVAADDDDKDKLWYNLGIYEADRLATEAGQYIPIVAYTEAKKLWQSPVAAGSSVTDALSSMNMIAHMILDPLTDNEDFEETFQSGKFAGENKLKVYIERRIPMWRGIKSSFIDIKKNNHFYKIGDNMLNFINVDNIVDELK